jgi:uncharacterized damage-inducible protein DinB
MELRHLFTGGCAMLFATTLLAQNTDPVSGTWTGLIGPGISPQFAVTLELKFDGKSAVTGTVAGFPTPGEVKSGTFDPTTGALKLRLGETGNAQVMLDIEGTIVLGSVTGRGVSAGNETGTFKFTKAGTAAAAAAPEVQPNDAMAAARGGFDEVSAWVTKAADMVPADKYTYKPVATVRTFGQLVGHVADAYTWYCSNAAGKKTEWADPVEKGNTDKATITAKLKQATDACKTVYAGGGQFRELLGNVGHTNLHYGNIITYMRMLGLVPPSS